MFPDPENSEKSSEKSSPGSPHPNQVPLDPITPEPVPQYSWVAMKTTPCSATCGTGSFVVSPYINVRLGKLNCLLKDS